MFILSKISRIHHPSEQVFGMVEMCFCNLNLPVYSRSTGNIAVHGDLCITIDISVNMATMSVGHSGLLQVRVGSPFYIRLLYILNKHNK